MEHYNSGDHSRMINLNRHRDDAEDRLTLYAALIHEANSEFNLTGHKTFEQIYDNLIIESILPFADADVPRGTSLLDIGCGAGIPGLPLAVFYPGLECCLIDSSEKKIDFVRGCIMKLRLPSVMASAGRIEDVYEQLGWVRKFDFVVSRAVANPYIISEYASVVLKVGGFLFLYSSVPLESHPVEVLKHLEKLGMAEADEADRRKTGIQGGILLKKCIETPSGYPRRFAAIKRISDRLYADN